MHQTTNPKYNTKCATKSGHSASECFTRGTDQEFDSINLKPDCHRHERGQQENCLVSHQKLLEGTESREILRAREVEKGNLNVGIHAHLVRMPMMPVMLAYPPAEAHADQKVTRQQAHQLMSPLPGEHLAMPGLMAQQP